MNLLTTDINIYNYDTYRVRHTFQVPGMGPQQVEASHQSRERNGHLETVYVTTASAPATSRICMLNPCMLKLYIYKKSMQDISNENRMVTQVTTLNDNSILQLILKERITGTQA